MRKIFLSIALLFVLAALIVFFLARRSMPPPVPSDTQNPVTLPTAGSNSGGGFTNNQDNTILVKTKTGGQIQVKDFLRAQTTIENPVPGYYHLGYHVASPGTSDVTASDNPPYLILYIASTQHFNVSLLKEPIGQTREDAETFLAAQLGITKTDLCLLDYLVSVPDHVNSLYASRDLGFSTCPGATTLPK